MNISNIRVRKLLDLEKNTRLVYAHIFSATEYPMQVIDQDPLVIIDLFEEELMKVETKLLIEEKERLIKELNFMRPTRVQFALERLMLPYSVSVDSIEPPIFLGNDDAEPVVMEGEILSSHRSWFLGTVYVVVKCGERLYEVEMNKCTVI